MQDIDNHNCAGLCSENYCSEVETQYMTINIHGMYFMIGFCKKHAEEFENRIFEGTKKRWDGEVTANAP